MLDKIEFDDRTNQNCIVKENNGKIIVSKYNGSYHAYIGIIINGISLIVLTSHERRETCIKELICKTFKSYINFRCMLTQQFSYGDFKMFYNACRKKFEMILRPYEEVDKKTKDELMDLIDVLDKLKEKYFKYNKYRYFNKLKAWYHIRSLQYDIEETLFENNFIKYL